MRGQLSRTVLRGLGGSNAPPATRLFGFEVREYLLTKWEWTCAYCGTKGVPLEVDHIRAKSRGGSDRISNLTVACHECNLRKGNHSIEEFLADSQLVLEWVLTQAKAPLRDAAAVNASRWALYELVNGLACEQLLPSNMSSCPQS